MAQLSRPYQIALGAVVVLGLIWAVALRAHGSKPSEPAAASPTASAPVNATATPGTAAGTKGTAGSTPIYHGAAPGVEGLTRAVARAHGAVATSQQKASELERKSSEASGESASANSAPAKVTSTSGSTVTQKSVTAATISHKTSVPAATVHKTTVHATTVHKTSVHTTTVRTTTVTARTHAAVKPHTGRRPQQVAVETELAHGKTVMLLFWDPRASVSREVLAQADALAVSSKGTVTVHAALANQVAEFGTITEVVHVYQTPTILIVNRRGVVSTLTGLTDTFALQQAVREARLATR